MDKKEAKIREQITNGNLAPSGSGIGRHTDDLLRIVIDILLDIRAALARKRK